jgi:hypothetical protein
VGLRVAAIDVIPAFRRPPIAPRNLGPDRVIAERDRIGAQHCALSQQEQLAFGLQYKDEVGGVRLVQRRSEGGAGIQAQEKRQNGARDGRSAEAPDAGTALT